MSISQYYLLRPQRMSNLFLLYSKQFRILLQQSTIKHLESITRLLKHSSIEKPRLIDIKQSIISIKYHFEKHQSNLCLSQLKLDIQQDINVLENKKNNYHWFWQWLSWWSWIGEYWLNQFQQYEILKYKHQSIILDIIQFENKLTNINDLLNHFYFDVNQMIETYKDPIPLQDINIYLDQYHDKYKQLM